MVAWVLVGAFSGAAARDCPVLTERDLNVITERDVRADLDAVAERDVRAGCGLLVVERVVDRVPGTVGACCAS